MHCPRCGTENQQGDRYCANCGRPLPGTREAARERRSLRESAARVIGTTPRARLLTGLTVAVIAVAVIAFLALDTSGGQSQGAAYEHAADNACVKAKKRIVAASRGDRAKGPGRAAADLIPIVAAWRLDLARLIPPADTENAAAALDTALRDVEIYAGAVVRTDRQGDRRGLVEAAGRLRAQSGRVEEAIGALGLHRCAGVEVGPQIANRG